MALIKCPECGKDISDKSERCIHCGFPLSNKNSNKLYDIELQEVGENKIKIIALLRKLNGLNLQDAKKIVEEVPCIIKEKVSEIDAKKIKDSFTADGALVKIKEVCWDNNQEQKVHSQQVYVNDTYVNDTKENKKAQDTKKSSGGCLTTLLLTCIVICVVGFFMQSCGDDSPRTETCQVCYKKFTNNEDVHSIILTNMCVNCYANFRYKQDIIDGAVKELERQQ